MASSQQGVGLNLRLEYIDQYIQQKPKLPFLEVIADNWLSPGPHHRKLELLRSEYQISFHCVGMNLGGRDALNINYLASIKKLIEKYQPFQVSDHICFQKDDDICFHDLLPIPFHEKSLLNMIERVVAVQETLGQTILLENLSYYTEFKSSTLSEVEFINALSEKSGSKILLDLNNILVNFKNLNTNVETFLNNLAWKNVKEIHLAGAEAQNDLIIDSHCSAPNAELLSLAKTWVEKMAPLPIVYERDKNLPEFNILLGEHKTLSESIFCEKTN